MALAGGAAPTAANDWLAVHVTTLLESFYRLTGRHLENPDLDPRSRARAVYEADYALLSHGRQTDPLFNYANATALNLFELDWATLLQTPSRVSAEPARQEARERFMHEVQARGCVEHYSGVRISASGRRFTIEDATVWNVSDAHGTLLGQAACFASWKSHLS